MAFKELKNKQTCGYNTGVLILITLLYEVSSKDRSLCVLSFDMKMLPR